MSEWWRDEEQGDEGVFLPMTENDYQSRVDEWIKKCFPISICKDKVERCDRFLEEALELVQAVKGADYTSERAHALVDYVFNREVGETDQEVGGVMVTLATLCNAIEESMELEGERELARISDDEVMHKLREKQAAKPVGSALLTTQDSYQYYGVVNFDSAVCHVVDSKEDLKNGMIAYHTLCGRAIRDYVVVPFISHRKHNCYSCVEELKRREGGNNA